MNIGTAGAIIITLGCAGGLAGAYCSYKAATGPQERRFVFWATVILVGFILSFLLVLRLFPQAKVWLWPLYPLMLGLGIRYLNRNQTAIRRREQTNG